MAKNAEKKLEELKKGIIYFADELAAYAMATASKNDDISVKFSRQLLLNTAKSINAFIQLLESVGELPIPDSKLKDFAQMAVRHIFKK